MTRVSSPSHPIILVSIDKSIIADAKPQKVAVPPAATAGSIVEYAADLFQLRADERSNLSLVRWGSPLAPDDPLGHVDVGEAFLLMKCGSR